MGVPGVKSNCHTTLSEGVSSESKPVPLILNQDTDIRVNQIRSESMFRIPIKLQGFRTEAVIDTAAEVTIISDTLHKRLSDPGPIVKQVTLNTAGKEMKLKGFIVGPVQINIGGQCFKENIYVAPIQDDMLLGLDFLRRHHAYISIPDSYIRIGGVNIPMSCGVPESTSVSQVLVDKTTILPPNSLVRVPCTVDKVVADGVFVVESECTRAVIPNSVYRNTINPQINVMNLSDRHCTLRKSERIAHAHSAGVVQPVPLELSIPDALADSVAVDKLAGVGDVVRGPVAPIVEPCLDPLELGGLKPEVNDGEAAAECDTNQTVRAQPEQQMVSPVEPELMVRLVETESGSPGVPAHLVDLYERGCVNLDADQKNQLAKLLVEFQDVFAKDDFDLGNFTEVEHSIPTGDALPIKHKLRRTPLAFVEEEEAHLQKMLDAGVITPSVSDWSSPPVLIRKRDGNVRWCLDFRALNKVTTKDVYPLPLVEDCMDSLTGQRWFSKLDANSAYWQIRIAEGDQKKTAFSTKFGLYQFVRMSFGLCNAPATYSRVMNLVLQGLTWNRLLAFLDDILALGRTFCEHLETLSQIFQRFRSYQLKLKPKKCQLFATKVEFLGRWVGPDGLELADGDVAAVREWKRPTCTKDVERFLGLVNYHRIFIPEYAKRAVPLYKLTGKQKFVWGEDQEAAFTDLKSALTTAPVLGLPNRQDQFILDTDASDYAIGAQLIQVQDGVERAISYGSFSLTKEQLRYCTTRKELLAVVRFTRQYRHYLLGRPFTLRTDHNSLTWLMSFKEPQGQIARWLEELSQYDMTVVHRPGSKHVNADALSRIPEDRLCDQYRLGTELSTLPCGGCAYCQRVHSRWGSFAEDVDEAVPLTMQARPSGVEQYLKDIAQLFVGPDSDAKVNQLALTVSVWDFQQEDLCLQQQRDEDFKMLWQWLKFGDEPSEGNIFLANRSTKHYWVNRDCFSLENDLIWRKNPKTGLRQLLVPQANRDEIMSLSHRIPLAGHQGAERTTQRIKAKYYWHRMSQDITAFVASCPECSQWKKSNRRSRCEMSTFHAGVPMERVHLDFLGPLPKTKNGNEHILVMVDQYTKWVECVPLPSQTAEITARAAVDQFFSRFGIPLQIHTDRGSNFESKLFSHVCELLQITKTRTTAYRPSANGQVERYNRTLMDAVRCFVGRNQHDWDSLLPQIAAALRASVNRSTGFTPNRLMLGREVIMPAELVYPGLPAPSETDLEQYVTRLEEGIRASHEVARQTLKQSQKVMKKDYDLRVHARAYSVGDAVYILNTASKKGTSKKLSIQWNGPGLVVKRITPYLYKVQMRKMVSTVNHDRMKPCLTVDLPSWLCKARSQMTSPGAETEEPETSTVQTSAELYCLCRGPDDGGFMIQCDACHEWYHGHCVNISEIDAESIDLYTCPPCEVGH